MTILLLGRYQFSISTEFSKNEYCPNVIFQYLPNIEIVYCPNSGSIIFATCDKLVILLFHIFLKKLGSKFEILKFKNIEKKTVSSL